MRSSINDVYMEIKNLTNQENEEENEEITIDLFDMLYLCSCASRIELFF